MPFENKLISQIENKEKQFKRFKFEISDKRKNSDNKQLQAFKEQIDHDSTDIVLQKVKLFLSEFSSLSPKDLEIVIVDGQLGEGTIKNKTIEMQMPNDANSIAQLSKKLLPHFGELTQEKIREIYLSLFTSTVLHEGIHGIFETKPGSKFHQTVERIAGHADENGKIATLLDEGIAYAIQGIFSKKIEPLGDLGPRVNETEKIEIKIRKILGERIKPLVMQYIKQGKKIDDNLIKSALKILLEIKKQFNIEQL